MKKYLLLYSLLGCYTLLLSQEIEWQKSLGGAQEEYLFDAIPTLDYGYIVAGSSVSSSSGTKELHSYGNLDYWIWKMKENGDLEWEQNLGGTGNDFLRSIRYTSDGGYILGGSSDSPINEVKTDSCRGKQDYWIVKLDPKGEVQWQKTLGGSEDDQLEVIRPLSDNGGYILAGTSSSSTSFEKEEETRGNTDYWIVKLDNQGDSQWQRTLGGNYADEVKGLEVLPENKGYMVYGYSNSTISGDKEVKNKGLGDVWVVRLTSEGEVLWQESYGGKGDDIPTGLQITEEGNYVLLGYSNSNTEEGTDYWLMEFDDLGNIHFEETYNVGTTDIATGLTKNKDHSYLISGYTRTNYKNANGQEKKGIEDYVAIKVDKQGKKQWEKQLGGKGSDRLLNTVQTRDGGYLLSGTSNSNANRDKSARSNGLKDYWVVKLKDRLVDTEVIEEDRSIQLYPVPTERYLTVVVPYDFQQGTTHIYDYAGRLLQSQELKSRTEVLDLLSLGSGLYIIKIQTDKEEVSKKIVKK
ncbi:DNA helicase [Flavobacteriaceae bacterium UJ101]|nr:DNA helicase [Flavobacteriaceae bacterium UJ101]